LQFTQPAALLVALRELLAAEIGTVEAVVLVTPVTIAVVQ
jgi:hypothetical protein